jgi:hypothetical protein
MNINYLNERIKDADIKPMRSLLFIAHISEEAAIIKVFILKTTMNLVEN